MVNAVSAWFTGHLVSGTVEKQMDGWWIRHSYKHVKSWPSLVSVTAFTVINYSCALSMRRRMSPAWVMVSLFHFNFLSELITKTTHFLDYLPIR